MQWKQWCKDDGCTQPLLLLMSGAFHPEPHTMEFPNTKVMLDWEGHPSDKHKLGGIVRKAHGCSVAHSSMGVCPRTLSRCRPPGLAAHARSSARCHTNSCTNVVAARHHYTSLAWTLIRHRQSRWCGSNSPHTPREARPFAMP